jgi:hypothetical protein
MKSSTFDAIVQRRTQARVEKRIQEFESVIKAALRTLTRHDDSCYVRPFQGPNWKPCLEQILKDVPNKGWPTELWDTERADVANEILSALDEVQRALLEPTVEPVNTPQEIKPK